MGCDRIRVFRRISHFALAKGALKKIFDIIRRHDASPKDRAGARRFVSQALRAESEAAIPQHYHRTASAVLTWVRRRLSSFGGMSALGGNRTLRLGHLQR